MGDRANILIKQPPMFGAPQYVFLYSHNGGKQLPATLQTALKRRRRWDDEAYLARVIFDAMTDGHHGEETGFGITTQLTETDRPLIVVNCAKQLIEFHQHVRELAHPIGPELARYTFKEYCDLPSPAWPDRD